MDELIIRVLTGEATPDEIHRVDRWRGESPENEARFHAVQQVWAATAPAPLPGTADPKVVPAILQAAATREEESGAAAPAALPSKRPAFPLGLRWALPLAAALAAVAFGVSRWSPGPTFTAVYQPDGASSETFVLADGSFARVAPGSRLSVLDRAGERAFELSGDALFAVTHDAARPFLVLAGETEVRVLGTRFEVRTLGPGKSRVVVLEGTVVGGTDGGRVRVAAGEVARVSSGAPPSVSTPGDVLAMLDWPQGILVFMDTPLAQVAREVGRHFAAEVEVQGEALGATRISAWYGNESLGDVAQSLCAATGASCTVTDSLVVMR